MMDVLLFVLLLILYVVWYVGDMEIVLKCVEGDLYCYMYCDCECCVK